MKRVKNSRYIITGIVATAMIYSGSVNTYAEGLSQTQIEQKTSEMEKKKENIALEKKQMQAEIERLDHRLAEVKHNIRQKEAAIQSANKNIARLKQDVTKLEQRIKQRKDIIAERLILMQKNGGQFKYVSYLLGSESISEIIARINAVSTLMKADESIIIEQDEDVKDLEDSKNSIIASKKKIEEDKAELVKLDKEIDKKMKEKRDVLDKLIEGEKEIEAEMLDLEEQKKIIEAQKEASASHATPKGGYPESTSNDFMRPAVGPITSGFGLRDLGDHDGVDIAKRGSDVPVVASASGVVIRSYYSSSYGNVVFLSHHINGRLFTTVYAHMENRAVQEGQAVEKGQFLGYMGNTGFSFGAHLHFEIHEGPWNATKSNSVDPMKYVQF
ncbi:MAG: murein hydrolase activator EnvC family protein [Bacillaceae bacterium]